ncbi:hypothetical protein ACH5RR_004250 [Cinchona calisaya]|uniref:RING-type domain-containing protein n=1 Tax=Cinchona calisaya TaxID=153742 RepID=A0ABD3AXU5_9GENT
MAVTSQESSRENFTDKFPLLMERAENLESQEHVIDIERVGDASSSESSDHGSPRGLNTTHHETGPSGNGRLPLTQPPPSASNGYNFRRSSLSRRREGFGRRWSPFNTMLWISLELVFTVGQIIAALVVLYLSRDENPQTPLFAWVVGYATGCALSLPLYYWRYIHTNQSIDQSSTQSRQGSRQGSATSEPNSYITISLTSSSEEEAGQNTSTGTWIRQNISASNARLSVLVDHFKMALDCFFAVWFVVGNVWIFGGHSSSFDAPNLYRLCLVFLTFSCIGYAMPFILCGMICCCLPCIIHILGVREDMNGMKGATEESINALPRHKFKLKRDQSGSSSGSGSGFEEGGFLAAGTEKERAISEEDAACCICLTNYEDDDELRELPCSHFFHTQCVDKWLKINASCPLCKFEIGGGAAEDAAPVESSQQE